MVRRLRLLSIRFYEDVLAKPKLPAFSTCASLEPSSASMARWLGQASSLEAPMDCRCSAALVEWQSRSAALPNYRHTSKFQRAGTGRAPKLTEWLVERSLE